MYLTRQIICPKSTKFVRKNATIVVGTILNIYDVKILKKLSKNIRIS